ncbi:hypothetical protein CSC62_08110 [Pseudoxanthomonas jiangsuensis]|nr:hypothetical protein CSC62_08110 [Pseudoxanthomonas jiangsuensis]
MIAVSIVALLVTRLGRQEGLSLYQYAYFYQQFFYEDYVHALAVLVATAAALALAPLRAGLDRLAGYVDAHPWRTSAMAFVVLLAAAKYVYQGHPYSMDEFAPVLQAHAFASGDLAARYPPGIFNLIIPPMFHGWFFQVDSSAGAAVSAYWPGLALLLAPLTWLHLESCLNPALSALALWLIGDLAVRLSGNPRSRGWAMLVALASPQFTVNAISFYAMPALLAFNLLFVWLLVRPRPGWRWALAAGVVGSFALVLHNPVPHALIAMPAMLWLVASRSRRTDLLALLAGYLPLGLLLGLGWPMLVASAGLGSGVNDGAVDPGFIQQWTHKLSQVLSLPDANVLLVRWYSLWKTWIWACPGAIVLALLGSRSLQGAVLLWGAFLLTMGFYFLVPYDQGFGWGYRYIHSAWMVVPLAAGVWLATQEGARRALGISLVVAGLLATPVFMWSTQQRISSAIAQKIDPPASGSWVVFVAMKPGHPTAELVQNYPDRPGVTYLFSRGEQVDASLMQAIAPGSARVAADGRGSLWQLPPGGAQQ